MRLRRNKPKPLRDEDIIPVPEQMILQGNPKRDAERKVIRAEAVRVLTKHHENGVTIPERQRVLVEDKDFAQAWINGEVRF